MSKSSKTYNKLFTKTFEKQLRKIRDAIRVKRIKEKIDEIVEYPYRNIDFGAGRWRGKRKERAGDDRIMFTRPCVIVY
jgi:mRNA-degrading endonuclease RelE of RelBE toxin-antitoxin system